ncbi:hypothetical protein A2U01_0055959, partial [Trifolium medium]|nr:hypothetical protein [Trifolium medium]
NLFTKLRNQAPELQPYQDGPLTAFDGTTTRSLGLIMLPTTFRDNSHPPSTCTIQIKFLVMPCNAGYNCILDRTTLNSLGAVPLMVH